MRLGKRFGMVRIFSVGQGVSSFPTVVVVKGNHIVNKVPGFQVQSETAARICGFAYAPRLTHGPRVQSRVHFHHLAPRDIATPFQLALARAPRRPYGLRHGARGVGCGRRSARSRTWRVSPPTASRPPKPLHTHNTPPLARLAGSGFTRGLIAPAALCRRCRQRQGRPTQPHRRLAALSRSRVHPASPPTAVGGSGLVHHREATRCPVGCGPARAVGCHVRGVDGGGVEGDGTWRRGHGCTVGWHVCGVEGAWPGSMRPGPARRSGEPAPCRCSSLPPGLAPAGLALLWAGGGSCRRGATGACGARGWHGGGVWALTARLCRKTGRGLGGARDHDALWSMRPASTARCSCAPWVPQRAGPLSPPPPHRKRRA